MILKDPPPDFDWGHMPWGSVHFPRAVSWHPACRRTGSWCVNRNFMTPRHDAGEFVCEVQTLCGQGGLHKDAAIDVGSCGGMAGRYTGELAFHVLQERPQPANAGPPPLPDGPVPNVATGSVPHPLDGG